MSSRYKQPGFSLVMGVSYFHLCLVLPLMLSPGSAFLPQKYGEVTVPYEFYFLRETVTFTCRVTHSSVLSTRNASSRDIYIRRANSEEPLGRVTSRDNMSVTVDVDVTSISDSGVYYCSLRWAPQRRLGLGNCFILVDYPLEAVNTMSCVTMNFLSVTCRYELPLDYLHPKNITATVFYSLPDYEDPEEECYRGAERSFTLGPGHTLDSNYTFTILLTHTERNESVLSRPFFFDPQRQVKPDKVKNLQSVNVTSRAVSLQWEPPDRRHLYICTTKYSTPAATNTPSREDVSGVYEPSDEQHIRLSGLLPFTSYRSSVQCRPSKWTHQPFGYNSDKVFIDFTTLPDAPDRPPLLAPAVSRPTPGDIQLYWRPLEKIRENGRLLHYHLKLEYDGHTVTRNVTIGQHTLLLPLGHLQSELTVSLSVVNTVGESPVSRLTVSPQQAESTLDPKFRVTGQGNTSDITFHWSAEVGVTCHVYWCHKTLESKSCQHNLYWKTLPCERNNVTVDTDQALSEQNLLLGISSEIARPHHTRTSIVWTHCIYVQHAVPRLVTGVKRSRTQPPGGMQVEWRAPDCVETPVYVSSYLISYCTVQQHTNTCAGSIQKESVLSRVTSHVISGLKLDRYRVTIRAVSLGLQGPDSAPLYFQVFPESSGQNTPMPLLVSMVVVAIVVLAALGSYFVYRFKNRYCNGVTIEMPEVPKDMVTYKPPIAKRSKRRRTILIVQDSEICDMTTMSRVEEAVLGERGSCNSESASDNFCEGDDYNIVAISTSGIEEGCESDGLVSNCESTLDSAPCSSVSPESAVKDMDWGMPEEYSKQHFTSDVELKARSNPVRTSAPPGYITLTDRGEML